MEYWNAGIMERRKNTKWKDGILEYGVKNIVVFVSFLPIIP
jgi:hypothetical protein